MKKKSNPIKRNAVLLIIIGVVFAFVLVMAYLLLANSLIVDYYYY
jgi:hypothetical protein